MIGNHIKVGWRMLLRTPGYSAINVGGLAIGMGVAMLIGLWVYDELSFNKYHDNYDSIVQLWHGETNPDTQEISGGLAMQFAVAGALKDDYQHYFKHVIRSWWTGDYTLATADTKFRRKGKFMEPAAIEVLSLRMIKGTYASLNDPKGFILSESTATAIFGTEDPIGKVLRIDNGIDVHVTGVYDDIPANSTFGDVQFIGTFAQIQQLSPWIGKNPSDWDNTYQQLYAQLQPNVTVESVNAGVRDLYHKYLPDDLIAYRDKYHPFLQVVPMSTWHLYSEFENGKPAGGRIVFVWLFGIIGAFVLLLACINFTNLSTARSEKRAREVGVRKTVGSMRGQLVAQFLSESFVVTVLAFGDRACVGGTFKRSLQRCLRKKDSVAVRQPPVLGYSIGVPDSDNIVGRNVPGLLPIFFSAGKSAQGNFKCRAVRLVAAKGVGHCAVRRLDNTDHWYTGGLSTSSVCAKSSCWL